MYKIDARFSCPNRFCEVRSDDSTSANSIVEELVSLALLDLFDEIEIKEVSVTFPSLSVRSNEQIAISICAQGYNLLPHVESATCLDGKIEDCLACALLELFGLLNVDRCAIV
ncbi:MAG TPA: hypothetical protein VFN35_04530 [Ktedonobacteraceae bacterium]|nr:hypothetical protein [Ktedonobacteraceae bacterium]